ncbi:ferredoxin [Streptomyces sp. SP17BM10]|uniref:ferredoxin n=1 Tax=Streptomyces sp. SP17BM10 TaxID=3002530 RepID=UPI002E797C55|nr:ferredoxin [Streptomyces sp. SP17BM10]MEE1783866.1 ferredoxin [Streptomyces sp. SP17BM10]
MKVSVDRDRCCSSGLCVSNAPELFDQDDHDSLVRLRRTAFRPEEYPDLRLAAELCPCGAITVTEDDATADTAPADGPAATGS